MSFVICPIPDTLNRPASPRMAAAPHPEILERMMAAMAMSEEDMAEFTVGIVPRGSDQYTGPVGEECLAHCCQNAPPEERARAARYLASRLLFPKLSGVPPAF